MSKVVLKDGSSMNNYQPPKKKMWWRYLLVWIAGFFSFALITGIVALILSTSFTSGEVLTMFGVDANAILQPYYQGLSILQLATTLPNQKYETLGDIYKITPMAKSIIEDTINPILDKELHFGFDWDEISIKPFALPVSSRDDGSVDTDEDLSTYAGRAIKEGVYLCDFINATSLPALVDLFLYPKDSVTGEFDYEHPYCLMDYISADSDFFNNIIDSVKVKDITGTTGNPLIDSDDGIGNWGLNDFTDENINGLPLSLFLDPNSTNPLIVKLRTEWTIGSLKNENNFKNLLLSEVINITDSSPKLLKSLAEMGYTIGQLESTNLFTVLTIGDVFDVSGNRMLEALEDTLLIDLEDEDTIMSLKLGDILPTTSAGDTIIDKFADKTFQNYLV